MNKILVNQDESFKDVEVKINKIGGNVNLKINGSVKILIGNFLNDTNITIDILEDSKLLIEAKTNLNNHNIKLLINSKNNSNLEFNLAIYYQGNNNLEVINNVCSSNTNNVIRIRAIDNGGKINILASGNVSKDTNNNVYLEDIKAISKDFNSVVIKPNLLVSSNDILASHNATIGPIKKEELFYLESRGITPNKAKEIIKEGFLNGILSYK